MTAGELIARVDELRPNAYSMEQKLRWLRRLDGQILAELEETHGALPPLKGEVAEQSEAGGVPSRPLLPANLQLLFACPKRSCKRNGAQEGKISISLAQVANKFAPRFGYKRAPGTFA